MSPVVARALQRFPLLNAASGLLATGTLRGMACMLVATLSTAGMLASVRHVTQGLHAHEVLFFRFLFGTALFLPVILRTRGGVFRTRRLGLHLLRGLFNVASMLVFFVAVTLAPLAKVVALKFSAPLFTTVIAVLFLGEAIRARRIAALLVGFGGVLVIFTPNSEIWDLGAGLVLLSSVLWGSAMVVIKILTRTESTVTMTAYTTVLALPVALAFAWPHWQAPSLEQLAWMVVVGVFGTLSHLAFAQAFKEADVTAVLPLDFAKLIWAAVIGYLAFGELPNADTWIGGAMIFGAVTYIALRERKAAGPAAGPPAVG